MPCLACGRWCSPATVCPLCASRLSPAPDRWLGDALFSRAAYVHDGPARRLVHRLKYHGQTGVARVLAAAMAPLLPTDAVFLAPIPRARLRRWRHGVDPAVELSRALEAITGIPVVEALRSDLWWPRHAAADRSARRPPSFDAVRTAGGGVLVDDVVTTGATAGAAARLFSMGFPTLVTATAAGTLRARSRSGSGEPGGEVAVTAARRATRSPVAHPAVERSPGAGTRPWQEHARRRRSS